LEQIEFVLKKAGSMRITFALFLLFVFTFCLLASDKDATLESTNLSLIIINTNGQTIVDDPKITADLKIIYNGPSELNHPGDPGNVYDGLCGIEYRGAYSQTLPQKPYAFETFDNSGNNLNVSLLGMPKENDWALIANYNDKTFMRNTLAFHLFEKMGHYAPRTRLCEVIVNDDYQGIYVLTEKIKRDKNRVDISKLDADDNAGDSLTGGYIFKIDYYDGSNSWESDYSPIDQPDGHVYFVYDYPAPGEMTSTQKSYIQDYVNTFETALYSDNYDDPQTGYRQFLNMSSVIDYFLIGELSRNVDAYKKSCYYYKDKDSKDALMQWGPVWDFDWAWKNMDDNCDIFAATDGSGWACKVNDCNNWPVAPAWIVRLLQDENFQNEVFTRYTDLRQTLLSNTYLDNYIDSIHTLVNDAQVRHYERWPILGINVGTPEVDDQPATYAGEITKFKNWVSTRLDWLDANMPGEYVVNVPEEMADNSIQVNLFPNPVSDRLYIESDESMRTIEIYNSTGVKVATYIENGVFTASIDVNRLNQGIFIARITFEHNRFFIIKFIISK
jgi:hypothetical protein